jgi:hypothetical protein
MGERCAFGQRGEKVKVAAASPAAQPSSLASGLDQSGRTDGLAGTGP